MPFYEFENKSPVVDARAFVHPEAVLIGDVMVDESCYVGAGAVLRGDIGSIQIGKGCNIQENCVLHTFPDRSVILHSNAHIGHGAILHGCEICSYVLVGMGAIVADGVKINRECMVGAGSFVPFEMEVPSNSLLLGSPARVVKELAPAQLDQIKRGLAIYQNLSRRYLKSFGPVHGNHSGSKKM
ncbi:MAG: phenylacetic acid degradation protein PaaY [Deltaproteobacteria bacterium]|jgi:phenylacetic acid degradation protein|nr:phenylacetic acid degradation protein PaaY [Deltaproteobacteria bacterium]